MAPFRRAVRAGAVVYPVTLGAIYMVLISSLRAHPANGLMGLMALAAGAALLPLTWMSARWGRKRTCQASLVALGTGVLAAAALEGRDPAAAGVVRGLCGLASAGGAAFAWAVEISDIDDRGKRAGPVAATACVAAGAALVVGAAGASLGSLGPGVIAAALCFAAAAWLQPAALPPASDCPPPSVRVELEFAVSHRHVVVTAALSVVCMAAAGAALGRASPWLTLPRVGLGAGGALVGLALLSALADRGAVGAGAALAAALPMLVLGAFAHDPAWGAAVAVMAVTVPLLSIPVALVSRTPEMLRPVGYLMTQSASMIGLGLGVVLASTATPNLVWFALSGLAAAGFAIL